MNALQHRNSYSAGTQDQRYGAYQVSYSSAAYRPPNRRSATSLEMPWPVYAMDWCKWPNHDNQRWGKIVVGSFCDDSSNRVASALCTRIRTFSDHRSVARLRGKEDAGKFFFRCSTGRRRLGESSRDGSFPTLPNYEMHVGAISDRQAWSRLDRHHRRLFEIVPSHRFR